jgi:hypothetical protein
MKNFLKKILVFVIAIPVLFAIVLAQADGYTDPFYLRFTTPKQSSLILGTSRAAQGLQPQVFKEVLNKEIFNYAFTLGHSPYGSIYLESIKKKLLKNGKNSTFIVAVDPWSISSISEDPNDSLNFREVNRILDNTTFVNMDPNYFYLIKNLKGNYYKVLYGNWNTFLHENGWLEVNISMDSTSVNNRTNSKIENYTKNLQQYKFSSIRFEYLIKTISYLNQYGKVFLVRLPVHERMLDIEQQLMPDFNKKMKELIPITEGYLDLTPKHEDYQYTDGNHLYHESGKIVTEEIAEWIKNIQLKNE